MFNVKKIREMNMSINKKRIADGLLIPLTFAFSVASANEQEIKPHYYGMIDIPSCTNHEGKDVEFIPVSNDNLLEVAGGAFGAATTLTEEKNPVILYDAEILPATHPKFQEWVLSHECAHHELTGHISTLSTPVNEDQTKAEKERDADCHSMRNLKEKGFTIDDVELVNKYVEVLYRDIVGAGQYQINQVQNHQLYCFNQS